ncbi:aldo/keto reductase [Nitrospina watsonii]|uniref:Aldo/keto reductase n=1 Tax=Nitrospina watsonii TaxID=1323948 RepID=A0ABM9HAR2_9BACT|nr:aldo/keto reductase [Nitrospina watsonii]CAI2717215.1 Aldo/keto reductase [Nitrospina watsonii]
MIAGHATPQGTAHYKDRFELQCGEGHFQQAGPLWWSSVGIGTYLGNADEDTDDLVYQSIVTCMGAGINVVDSAINYRGERGERCVGRALAELVAQKTVRRNEVIVCSKGGFLPQSLGVEWFEETYGKDEVPGIGMDDLVADCHCMHPLFLEDQLERSRANLGLETIDVYYVHNPETQLGNVSDKVFYDRLEKAFAFLEQAVQDGRIRAYGLATWNGLRLPPGQAKHISLERAKKIAQSVSDSGADHFEYVQLPFNLMMREAVGKPTQPLNGKTTSAIVAARDLGLIPVISGSIGQGKLEPLSEQQRHLFGDDAFNDLQRALQFTRSTPGIAAALVGMKKLFHIEENLAVCRHEPLGGPQFKAVFQSL